MARFSFIVAASLASFSTIGAGSALRSTSDFVNERISETEIQKSLLDEIQGAFGTVDHRGRLARLEAAIQPMFKALPKNEFGNLGHATVRYALHRVFVQRHGWYIKGLEPTGESWSSGSATGVLKDRVASHVQELFEKRLGGRGFNLHDTAVMAATIEHLIHDEATDRLSKAYDTERVSREGNLTQGEMEGVLDGYMKRYLLPESIATMVSNDQMEAVYPGWLTTQTFVRDVKNELAGSSVEFSFDAVTRVVEEVGERFGSFQGSECREMKTRLVSIGDDGIGRIPLSRFYQPAVEEGIFEFQESPEYLRQMGVLDETDSSNPSVIVPNYLNSNTNCLSSSSLYSICCLDECEQLVGHLEREVAAPETSPAVVAGLVADMKSSSMTETRALSPQLLSRLDEIAAKHDGTVQLHSRLFAQWLHHAFPRECPFPIVSGEATPRTPDEWMVHSGSDVVASVEEMQHYVKASPAVSESKTPEISQWQHEDELLTPRIVKKSSPMRRTIQLIMFVAVVGAMVMQIGSSGATAMAAFSSLAVSSKPNNVGGKRDTALSPHADGAESAGMMRLRSRPGASYLP